MRYRTAPRPDRKRKRHCGEFWGNAAAPEQSGLIQAVGGLNVVGKAGFNRALEDSHRKSSFAGGSEGAIFHPGIGHGLDPFLPDPPFDADFDVCIFHPISPRQGVLVEIFRVLKTGGCLNYPEFEC